MPDRETTPHRSHSFDVGDHYGDNLSRGIILSMYLDGMTNCWNTVIKGFDRSGVKILVEIIKELRLRLRAVGHQYRSQSHVSLMNVGNKVGFFGPSHWLTGGMGAPSATFSQRRTPLCPSTDLNPWTRSRDGKRNASQRGRPCGRALGACWRRWEALASSANSLFVTLPSH
jgi:hypothetical protein